MPASQAFVNDPGAVLEAAQTTTFAVVDTNVLLDWLVFAEPSVTPLAEALASGRLRLVACAATRAELGHMVAHTRLERWGAAAASALSRFDAVCVLREAPPAQHLLRPTDRDDQVFIDLALDARVPWLLTRDKALLKLARRARARGLSIVAPEAWPLDGA